MPFSCFSLSLCKEINFLNKGHVLMKQSRKYFSRSQKNFLKNEQKAPASFHFVTKRRFFILIRKSFFSKNHLTKQALFLNQNGLSTIAPAFLSLIFSLGVLYTYKAIRINQVIRERKQVYLCLKETEFLKTSYVKTMGNLNIVIHAAFLARAIPPISPYAQRIQKTAQYFQQLFHFSQLKNSLSLKNCSSLVSLNYIRTLPYKSKLTRLIRRLDGTAVLKKKAWKEYLWSNNENIFLQSSFKMKSRFSTNVEIQRKEFSKEALQSLRESYGPLFSFSY